MTGIPAHLSRTRSRRSPDRRPGGVATTIRVLGGVVAGLLLVVILVSVALALDARTAYTHLRTAASDVAVLKEQAVAGDFDGSASTALAVQEAAAGARAALSGPHWDLAGHLPVVGDDVRAVQAVAVVADDLADGALARLASTMQAIDPAALAPQDGRIDLAPLQAAAPDVMAAHETVTAADETLASLDTSSLLDEVRRPVEDFRAQIDELAGLTATASRATQLLPPMLGADGPREYLVLVQNNSEPRATGGLPGAYILMRADGGAIEFVEQRSAVEIGSFPEPVLELTRAERGIYGTQLGRYPGNVTSTPDFPRTAELAREMWRRATGQELDGVVSVDPVALGMLIGATGPVDLPTGQQLTAESTAQLLLNEPYLRIDDALAQDAYFATAAAAVFDGLLSRGFDPVAVLDALDTMAHEGRLMMWSAHDDEQVLISGTQLSGELRGHVENSPVVGIYVHDTSAAKIAYYEHIDAEIATAEERSDGSRRLAVTVIASSKVPDDVNELPRLLTGGSQVIPVGATRSQISVYAPTGSRIVSASTSDPASTSTGHVHDGLAVSAHTLMLEPGEIETLTVEIDVPAELSNAPLMRITPGPQRGQFSAQTLPESH